MEVHLAKIPKAVIHLTAFCLALFLGSFSDPIIYPLLSLCFGLFGPFLLVFSVKSLGLKAQVLLSTLGYGVIFGFQISWLGATEYHGSYISLVYAFIVILFSLQFALFSYVLFYYRLYEKVTSALFAALLWAFIEWTRLYFLSGFTFGALGTYLIASPELLKIASILGLYGLSFFALLFNLMLLSIFSKSGWIESAKTGGVIIFVFCLGLMSSKTPFKETGSLKCLVLQPQLKVSERVPVELRQEEWMPLPDQLAHILRLLAASDYEAANLIVMPESVMIGSFREEYFLKNFVKKHLENLFPRANFVFPEKSYLSGEEIFKLLAAGLQVDIFLGYDREDKLNNLAYNSLFLVQKNGAVYSYDKRILVPMGETLPFECLRSIAARYGVGGFFSKGKESVFSLNGIQVLPSICYEDTFPFCGFKVFKPIDLLLNVTNDGWFYPSNLPEKHFALSLLRAVEMGSPMIRACEQSMSGIIEPDGSYQFLKFHRYSEAHIYLVHTGKKLTLYPYLQEYWLFIGLAFGLFSLKRSQVSGLLKKQKLG